MQISVLMTVFNGERWLNDAIRSTLDQTYRDFEFIIVDDGSTDTTPEILELAARRDHRIRVVRHENIGVSRSVNRILPEIRNDWIARLDADDMMHPQRLERQVAFLEEHPDLAVASCFADYVDDRGEVVGVVRKSPVDVTRGSCPVAEPGEGAAFHPVGRGSSGGRCSKRWTATVPEFSVTEDTDLWNRIAEAGYPVLVQPEVLMRVRVHAGSLTRSSLVLQTQQFRWLKDGARRRRSGQPEISFEEHLDAQRTAGIVTRVNIWRSDIGQIHYKQAAVARTDRVLGGMCWHLGVSLLFTPLHLIKNLRRKATFRSRRDSTRPRHDRELTKHLEPVAPQRNRVA